MWGFCCCCCFNLGTEEAGSYLAGFRVSSRPARSTTAKWFSSLGRSVLWRAIHVLGPCSLCPPAAHLPFSSDSAPHLSGTASRLSWPSASLPVSPSGPAASLRLLKLPRVTRSVPGGHLGYLGGLLSPARVSVCLSFCAIRSAFCSLPSGPSAPSV